MKILILSFCLSKRKYACIVYIIHCLYTYIQCEFVVIELCKCYYGYLLNMK